MMNKIVGARRCGGYELEEVYRLVEELWLVCKAPDPKGLRILVKPNILSDEDPVKAITTHPVVAEAVVRMLQKKGATVIIGDSPALHGPRFRGKKAGIWEVSERTGAMWADFTDGSTEVSVGSRSLKITRHAFEVDMIVSLPKMKTHELMYFTGAIKNTLGLVPNLHKAKMHAIFQSRNKFGNFLVDLNEVVLPTFFIMDAIIAMEGPGPANGSPVNAGLLLASSNPLALDIVASSVAGYDPMQVPTNANAMQRGVWLKDIHDYSIDGPSLDSMVVEGYRKLPVTSMGDLALQFIVRRVRPLRRLEKRPLFIHDKCIGCRKCIEICPVTTLRMDDHDNRRVLINDSKCIRCYCCHEVCPEKAIEIRRKLF